ncbi:MAG: hypothetical protein KIT11_01840 [Fimbriimonadaceae bacterium]|nr:hypothetical protein [Fimbriimonadaceae bacterium]QYK54887.1 MAG: hypothetical protein KF733_07695 [Fimbriimonadaceae bacterium]
MTARELMTDLLEETGYQVEKVFEGLEEAQKDAKAVPSALSPMETLHHLAEAYVAFLAHVEGRKHEWGSLEPTGSTLAERLDCWRTTRAKAVEAAASDEEHVLMDAKEYLVLHDTYHVGQMATLRVALGGWDPYSIYH